MGSTTYIDGTGSAESSGKYAEHTTAFLLQL
jgi:hypothetical protein